MVRLKKKKWNRKKMMSMVIRCVGFVQKTMLQMSFGFAVIYARGGTMENV